VARIWPIDPVVPAPAIEEMKASVVQAAANLFSRGRDVEDHKIMAVAEDLYAWAVTLERMATSSPTYHGALGRTFKDHPRYGESLDDRLIPHRAQADLLGFLAIGDLVLNRLGRLWMRQLGAPVASEEEGFQALLRACDNDVNPAVSDPVRRLQVSLRSARNRLLAHLRPDHAQIRGWAPDDTPHVTLVGLAGPADQQAAVGRLALELIAPPPAPLVREPHVEAVALRSTGLTSRELWALDRAMRTVGFVSLPVADVVRDVLRLAEPLDAVAGGFDFDPRDLADDA
jgi:hypothetical protein